MSGLAGRRALVTGGSRGIGAAIARRLAADGAQVVITGRDRRELSQVASGFGGDVLVADLSSRADTDRMVAELFALGRVDILVNNAGAAESAPLDAVSDELWDRMMELNATAPLRLARALIPAMVAARWGRVINIASNAGVSGYAYSAAYCAAKHALVGMTRALAVDLARTGVTINAICPGWVATRLADEAVARIAEKTGRSAEVAKGALEAMSPQRRMIEPDEVAHAAWMLCAEQARGIHGHALLIDGGQTLK